MGINTSAEHNGSELDALSYDIAMREQQQEYLDELEENISRTILSALTRPQARGFARRLPLNQALVQPSGMGASPTRDDCKPPARP